MIDEIVEPSNPPIIVLKHLAGNLLEASIEKSPNRREIRHVSRRVLEALKVLHDGYVHTRQTLA